MADVAGIPVVMFDPDGALSHGAAALGFDGDRSRVEPLRSDLLLPSPADLANLVKGPE